MGDVLRVVGTRLRGETELGADECCRHFCDDFLGRVSVRSEPVAELAIEPVGGAAPMRKFMRKNAHVSEIAIHGRRADEGFLVRHGDLVRGQRIECPVAAVIDLGAGCGDEAFELSRLPHGTQVGRLERRGVESIDLRGIEDG